MKMNIIVVELSEHELGFMAEVLEATLEIGEALLVHPEPGTAMDVSEEAPLWQQLEPRTTGAAAMAVVPGFDYGGEEREVIKYMLLAASPERPSAGSLGGHGSGVHARACSCKSAASVSPPTRRLQPRPCTSQEGHRWLGNCRYEPPRCGAVWCGQVGCDVSILCDCVDPQAHAGVGESAVRQGEPLVLTTRGAVRSHTRA